MQNRHIPLPEGYLLEPADDLRRLSGGRILIGGSPLSIVRLSQAGADTVTRWFDGEPIGAAETQQRLARRLRANAMAHLRAPERARGTTDTTSLSVTVIIPVKDDKDGLDQTIESLLGDGSPFDSGTTAVVVIDDGSATPVTIAGTDIDGGKAVGADVTVIRNSAALGPGRARQRALNVVTTDVVVCIDAGVTLTAADLIRLCECFDDPAVLAAAPRIRSRDEDHLVGRYDRHRSPLDLGPSPSLVGPGRTVPYVPTACLAARTDALHQAGGFDPVMRYGEDVDLVWRLAKLGDVRYVPDIEATHPPRQNISAMAAQRLSYGTAAAPLASRHGDAVSPARLSGWSVLISGLAFTGHPVVAVAAATGTGLALRPKIEPLPDATVEALLLTARGHWYGGLSLVTAVARTWSPFVAAAMVLLPSQRRRMALLLAAGVGRRLLDGPRDPAAAGRDLALGAIDDLSYCAGVWKGVLAERSARALAPKIVSWPGPKGATSERATPK